MPTTKPTKPSITLPGAFGTSVSNVKTPFTAQELIDGYSASIQQVLDGGNVNWLNDTLFKYLTYTTSICDWLNGISVGNVPFINSSNQLDSVVPVIASANNTFSGTNTFNNTVTADISGNAATATNASNDGDGNQISSTYMKTNASNVSSTGKQTIVGWGMPDYSSGVSKSDNTQYTATSNGWLEICTSCYNSSASATLTINGISRNIATSPNGSSVNYSISPIAKGDTYKVVYARTDFYQYMNFYPCIGG